MIYSDKRCLEGITPTNSVIGLESALSYYGLCDFADQYIVLINRRGVNINSRYFKFVSIDTQPSDIVDYPPNNGRLKITTPEATICEMILCDRRDDFIIQSLQNYIIFKENDSYNEDLLIDKSKKYGVYEKLMEYLGYAHEDLDDMC